MWRGVGHRVYLTPLCPVDIGIVWIRDTRAQYVALCPMVRVLISLGKFSKVSFLVYVLRELLKFRSFYNCLQPVSDSSLSTSSHELANESLSDVYATDHTFWNSLSVFVAINSSL